jgi:hypothetical protein
MNRKFTEYATNCDVEYLFCKYAIFPGTLHISEPTSDYTPYLSDKNPLTILKELQRDSNKYNPL